ncbi:MAG: tetratricopeptide repeat protein, partial [Planctomycetota bacterium]
VRGAVATRDREVLRTLAGGDIAELPPPTLELLTFTLEAFGEADEAVALARRALDRHPDNARLHRSLCNRLVPTPLPLYGRSERRRGREALTHARAAVAIEPDNAMSHFFLGVLLIQLGDMGAAIGPLERADELSELTDWPRVALAFARGYVAPNDPDVVAELQELHAEGQPPMQRFWIAESLTTALEVQGRRGEALDVARSMFDVEIDWSDNMRRVYLGSTFGTAYSLAAQLGRPDEALAAFEIARTRGFDDPVTFSRFLSTADVSRVEDPEVVKRLREIALELAETGIDVEPESTEAWDSLGLALLRLEDYEEALDAFTVAVDVDRGATNVTNWLAQSICWSEMGNEEQASLWFERARPHLDGTIDRALTSWQTGLARQAAERLGVSVPARSVR